MLKSKPETVSWESIKDFFVVNKADVEGVSEFGFCSIMIQSVLIWSKTRLIFTHWFIYFVGNSVWDDFEKDFAGDAQESDATSIVADAQISLFWNFYEFLFPYSIGDGKQ